LYGRPEQISRLLDRLLADSVWASRIDSRRIGFVGYSAGGFTGLELLGGHPDVQLLRGYCTRHARDPLYCAGGLRGHFRLTGRYAPPNRDARIRAVALWAPAFSFLFDSAALTRIANTRTPLLVVRGTSDSVVVEPDNVAHLRRYLGRLGEFESVAGAGHYTFLPPCGPELARIVPDICVDPPGVSRTAVHQELNKSLVAFFARALRR
jgi:predicted dienelactone hydrolase